MAYEGSKGIQGHYWSMISEGASLYERAAEDVHRRQLYRRCLKPAPRRQRSLEECDARADARASRRRSASALAARVDIQRFA